MILLVLTNLMPNVFETYEQIVSYVLAPRLARNFADRESGHSCLVDRTTQLRACRVKQQVIRQNGGYLVPRQVPPRTVVVNPNAETVRLRVGDPHRYRPERSVTAVRTGALWAFPIRHMDGIPQLFQPDVNGPAATAAERREQNPCGLLRSKAVPASAIHVHRHVIVESLAGHILDKAGRNSVLVRHMCGFPDVLRPVGKILVVGREILPTFLIIDLYTIVIRRVMRGGEVDAARSMKPPYQEGQFGRGEESIIISWLEHVHEIAVLRVHTCGQVRQVPGGDALARVACCGVVRIVLKELEHTGEVVKLTDIIGNNDRSFQPIAPVTGKEIIEIIAVSLDRKGNDSRINAVRAEPHGAADPAGPEWEAAPE